MEPLNASLPLTSFLTDICNMCALFNCDWRNIFVSKVRTSASEELPLVRTGQNLLPLDCGRLLLDSPDWLFSFFRLL